MNRLRNIWSSGVLAIAMGIAATVALLFSLFAPGLFALNTLEAQEVELVNICHFDEGEDTWVYAEVTAEAWAETHLVHGDFLYEGMLGVGISDRNFWCENNVPGDEEPELASLTVEKVVVGGDMDIEDFDLFINGMAVLSGVATTTLSAGTYTVTEDGDDDYIATFSGACDDEGLVTLLAGDDLTCTVTNTFSPGDDEEMASLTVEKVVVGGDMDVEDFDLFINGMAVLSGVATTTLSAGTYTVTEDGDDDYIATFSGACDDEGLVTLLAGDDLTCTVTNTFDPGDDATTTATTTLTITKEVVGGDMSVEDFPLFINGMAVMSGVATTTLSAGTYTVTETGNEDYVASFSGDCDASGMIDLELGDDLSCTITNTFSPATTTGTTTLTVIKVVDGGNAATSSFPLFVNGMSITNGVATTTLGVGAFTVTETDNPDYIRTFGGDCDASGTVILEDGDDKTCVVTNRLIHTGGGPVDDDDDDDQTQSQTQDQTQTIGNINIDVDGSDVTVNTPFPGQVLGATSFVPTPVVVPFTGQVLGAQSAVPGLPLTGGDPTLGEESTLPNTLLLTLAGSLGVVGLGLILTPASIRGGSRRSRVER